MLPYLRSPHLTFELDMESEREVQEVTQSSDSNKGVQGGKPKRAIHRPAYLKDYA